MPDVSDQHDVSRHLLLIQISTSPSPSQELADVERQDGRTRAGTLLVIAVVERQSTPRSATSPELLSVTPHRARPLRRKTRGECSISRALPANKRRNVRSVGGAA